MALAHAASSALETERRGPVRVDAREPSWLREGSRPCLIRWLNAVAPGCTRPGCRVAVVGCGLGEDVEALADRGYDAIGFDACPDTVRAARAERPSLGDAIFELDLFDLPPRLRRRFELVVEVDTLGWIDPDRREEAARAIASLVCPHGRVLAIALDRGGAPSSPPGINGSLGADDLQCLFAAAGLRPEGPIDVYDADDEGDGVTRVARASFVHG